MAKYFVCSNLNHDGEGYVRGDEVEMSAAAAKSLLADGVLSEEKVEKPAKEENRDRVKSAPKKSKPAKAESKTETEPTGDESGEGEGPTAGDEADKEDGEGGEGDEGDNL